MHSKCILTQAPVYVLNVVRQQTTDPVLNSDEISYNRLFYLWSIATHPQMRFPARSIWVNRHQSANEVAASILSCSAWYFQDLGTIMV